MSIAANLSARRRELGLKQSELAEEIDVTPQHISNLETDGGDPSLDVLVALSKALGVTTDFLLTGRESVPLDATGAIRGEPKITAARKRLLIELLNELRTEST